MLQCVQDKHDDYEGSTTSSNISAIWLRNPNKSSSQLRLCIFVLMDHDSHYY